MITANFWDYILAAVIWMINIYVAPLFGGVGGMHQALGLGSKMLYNVRIILEMLFLAVGNFDLTLVGIMFLITIPMWLVWIALKVYLFVKKLIPVIG